MMEAWFNGNWCIEMLLFFILLLSCYYLCTVNTVFSIFSNVSLSYHPLIFSLFIICIENMNLDKHVFIHYIEKYILAYVIDKGLEYPSDRRICCHIFSA